AAVVTAAAGNAPATAGVAAGTILLLSKRAAGHGWHGCFLLVFLAVMIVACLTGALFLAPRESWEHTGPVLLFLVLLTLLNAPFDWASLGLTRALLRRGLERENIWWPYGYACLDAFFATGIIALLALIMVVGVQAFDELAVHTGGPKAA